MKPLFKILSTKRNTKKTEGCKDGEGMPGGG